MEDIIGVWCYKYILSQDRKLQTPVCLGWAVHMAGGRHNLCPVAISWRRWKRGTSQWGRRYVLGSVSRSAPDTPSSSPSCLTVGGWPKPHADSFDSWTKMPLPFAAQQWPTATSPGYRGHQLKQCAAVSTVTRREGRHQEQSGGHG